MILLKRPFYMPMSWSLRPIDKDSVILKRVRDKSMLSLSEKREYYLISDVLHATAG